MVAEVHGRGPRQVCLVRTIVFIAALGRIYFLTEMNGRSQIVLIGSDTLRAHQISPRLLVVVILDADLWDFRRHLYICMNLPSPFDPPEEYYH